jgi:hypothetical protein
VVSPVEARPDDDPTSAINLLCQEMCELRMTSSSMPSDIVSKLWGAVMTDLHSEADRGQADLTEDNLGGKTSSAANESDRGSRWTVANDEMDKTREQSIQAK